MGDLDLETSVVPADPGDADPAGPVRRFTARLDPAWEIWGPEGGYVAAVALRAAGAASPFDRPASILCHFLGVAAFDTVDLEVTVLRRARTALSQRVDVSQGGKPVLTAIVWSVGDVEGLEHHLPGPAPEVPGPEGLRSFDELWNSPNARFAFWDNIEARPTFDRTVWPPTVPLDPRWRTWLRCRPRETFDDPWVDAARSVVLLDVGSWPAANQHHAWRSPPFTAPSLDLAVAFHEPAPEEPWLLADAHAPVAGDGLLGWHGRLWSLGGRLVASAQGQALFRRVG